MSDPASEANRQGGSLATLAKRAEPYAALLTRRAQALAEAPTLHDELRLQALWKSDKRPKNLTLPDGTPVEVLDPGHWNRTAGPDFRDALLSIGGTLRRGDVELHLHPADWDLHGHAADSAYDGVILHVTWSPTPPAKTLPAAIPTLALRPFAERQGTPDFAALPLPHADVDAPHPCQRLLAATPGACDRLVTAAGAHRLHLKSRAFADSLTGGNAFQTLYEALLAAMGYRRNTAPFRRLAQEVPFERLRVFPSLQRFAILAGVGGLLDATAHRELWDLWWTSGLQPPLRPYAWDFRALRPQNHPFRRLAGAVGILHDAERLLNLSLGALPEALTKASTRLCEPLRLSGAPIGANRANAIVTNLFVPYRLALGTLAPDRLNDLPGEDVSQPMREAWHRLTGSLRNLPKDGLRQQGLLQIHADFCANTTLTCDTCPLAAHA